MNCAPYDGLVGGAFLRLPPGVRLAHSVPLEAVGQVDVVRARGLAGMIAALMRLPRSGEAVPCRLRVEATLEGVRWIRHFGRLRVVTSHSVRNGILAETYGAFRVGFRLVVQGETLVYEPVRTWFGPLPLPAALAPRIHATVSGHPDGWQVSVQIEHPQLGLLCRYFGIMRQA